MACSPRRLAASTAFPPAPDVDGDGVPDGAETAHRTAPDRADSDGDGLSDGLELILATNPLQRDADQDGLDDNVEIAGWLFTYGPGKTTLVTSDPNQKDTDGDGLDDRAEKEVFRTNPNVFDANTLGISAVVDDLDRFLGANQRYVYTATVSNNFAPGSYAAGAVVAAAGTLTSAFASRLGAPNLSTTFLVAEGQQHTQSAARTIVGGGSGLYAIDATVSAGLKALTANTPPGTTPPDFTRFNQTASLFLTIDTDPGAATFFNPDFVRAGETRIVGGAAEDPTSYPTLVEFQVDGGSFQPTVLNSGPGSRQGAWTYAWTTPSSEGAHTVVLRVTDAVGIAATMPGATVYVDSRAPGVTAAQSGNPIVPAGLSLNYRFTIPLDGTAADPDSGAATSGVAKVEVLVEPNGAGWQEARITPGRSTPWSIDYELATMDSQNAILTDPTGQYTVTVRAFDTAGNVTAPADRAQTRVRVDATPPQIGLDATQPALASGVISQSLTLTGRITDVGAVFSGVAGAEISFTSDKVTDVYSETLLLLALNDPLGSTFFVDESGQGNDGVCGSGGCPASAALGRFGTAVAFDGGQNQTIQIPRLPLSNTHYALTGWFNTTCANCGILAVEATDAAGAVIATDRQLYLSGGNLCADVVNNGRETICSVGVNYADGQWHMLAQVLEQGSGPPSALCRRPDRGHGREEPLPIRRAAAPGLGPRAPGRHPGLHRTAGRGADLPGGLDPGPGAGDAPALAAVTVTGSGPEVATAAWSLAVPTDLEGNYQIDLTATDRVGNRNDQRGTWNKWRGEIDLLPPRIDLAVNYSGAGSSARSTFTGSATDLNLTERNIYYPCADPVVTRTYNTLTRPNEPQRLNRLDFTCSVAGFVVDNLRFQACDSNGRCAARLAPAYRVYVTTTDAGILRTRPYSGAGMETVVPAAVTGAAGGLALDPPRGKLYWGGAGTISRANLDGSGVARILTGLADTPRRLAVNSSAGKLYWTEGNSIRRANLDGSGAETILSMTNHAIVGLAIDESRGRLYYVGTSPGYLDVVYQAGLDGQNSAFIAWDTGAGRCNSRLYDLDDQPAHRGDHLGGL
jgi:hypothetical protein